MSLLLSWQPGNGVDELQVSVLIFRSWIGVNFVKYVLTLCRRTDEGSRRKCGQYWPLEEGGQEVYGHIAVVNQRVDRHSHYNHTTLELHNTEVRKNILLNVAAKKSGIAWKAPVTEWDWYPHHILCIPQNVQSTPLPVERFSTSRMHFLSYIFSIIKRITCKILFVFRHVNRDKWVISSTSAGPTMASPPQQWLWLTSWELWRDNREKWSRLWDLSGQATRWDRQWWSTVVQGLGEQVRCRDKNLLLGLRAVLYPPCNASQTAPNSKVDVKLTRLLSLQLGWTQVLFLSVFTTILMM